MVRRGTGSTNNAVIDAFTYTLLLHCYCCFQPTDFRLDPGSLQASGQMAKLASEVTRHVLRAGGRRAILIGHSLGAGVALQMLRHDAAL
jgi:pimeloyl-ACP methyl ester carboxylesterase